MKPLLYIDLFCGAGGTTTGVETAKIDGHKCAKVIACINHDKNAIASHLANHPEAVHYTEDIRTFNLEPLIKLTKQKKEENPEALLVLWASLECTNFSRAKGGKPRDPDSRTLAEHLFRYIEALDPDYIQIENVEEFMSWGDLDENGKPISKHKGTSYLKWCNKIEKYGFTYNNRILNAADYGAYTTRKRYFGQFAKKGLPHAFPEATHSKKEQQETNLFNYKTEKWKPVREVLDLKDEGESIFDRKKPLCEATLKRIYAGLIKFIAGGEKAFLIKWNSMNNGQYSAPSINEPCPTISTQNRMGITFISKAFSGDTAGKNISTEQPCGTITTKDHHQLLNVQFINKNDNNKENQSIEKSIPILCTVNHKTIKTNQFLTNEYSGGGQLTDINLPCPAIMTNPKQKLLTCKYNTQFLMNPQYNSKGNSVNNPCFTLIARMDKMPPYLISTKEKTDNTRIKNQKDSSPIMKKIKNFMIIYGISDIKMRMLKISELKRIMGFPENYALVGTQAEQKKFIGNAVEVNISRKLCEALSAIN